MLIVGEVGLAIMSSINRKPPLWIRYLNQRPDIFHNLDARPFVF